MTKDQISDLKSLIDSVVEREKSLVNAKDAASDAHRLLDTFLFKQTEGDQK